jgi:hypothetical protein
MGLNLQMDFAVPFNPNLNPQTELRDFPGDDTDLLAAYHLDLSPSPTFPVAGTAEALGAFSGGQEQTRLGYLLRVNDVLNSNVIPGAALTGLTMFAVARRTGVTPPGASLTAGMCCVGPVANAPFRLDMAATRPSAGNVINSSQTAALEGDTSVWDFYAFAIDAAGCALYRPRISPLPVTDIDTIATVGAANLNNSFRIGTGGTAITWSEVEVMAAGLFGARLSTPQILALASAYADYAAAKGVIFGE